jgi:RNA polymerase sigma factor (sigma-70 family)
VPGELASIESCIPALRRYARVLLHASQDADDLVHDTLARALDKLPARHGDVDVRPWLFAMIHNLFVSQMRWTKVRRRRASPNDVEATAGPIHEHEDGAPRWQDVMRAFNTIPEAHRVVLLLVSIENFSYGEVARILSIPLGSVMSRLGSAREGLRTLMQGDGESGSRLRRVK